MDEEVLNLQIRKFLKKVGITSQREIEKAVRAGMDSGVLKGAEKLNAKMTLLIPDLNLEVKIEDQIALQ